MPPRAGVTRRRMIVAPMPEQLPTSYSTLHMLVNGIIYLCIARRIPEGEAPVWSARY